MLFKVSPILFSKYPGALIGVVVAYDINNEIVHKEVNALFEQVQDNFRAYFTGHTFVHHPYIESWIEAYKKFGTNPKKYVPSVQNLGQRALKKPLSSINTAVDVYNMISLKYLLPAGGEDLDTIKGDIELTIAGAHEKAIYLLGDAQLSTPEPGEVLYKDNNGAICRRWNWKEADRIKLTSETKHAIFVVEALPPVEKNVVEAAINELATLIEQYCGGKATVALIDAHNTQVLIKTAQEKYVSLDSKKQMSDISQAIYGQTDNCAFVDHEEMAQSQEYQARVHKVEQLRAMRIEPWPEVKSTNVRCQQIIEQFKESEESQKVVYEISGRVMALREHGKTVFAHIQDCTGQIQLYFKQADIGEQLFDVLLRYIDVGDIIWVSGTTFKTRMGEITLRVLTFSLESKCLHPLPEKFHGLTDIEIKYRQRYLDLIVNSESRERFVKRSLVVRAMRQFLDNHGFLEVETPMLHPIPGGAVARPFVTHHNALGADLYLRIAPELYLKRLVIGGIERVYEINRNFRNEGVSTKHNPEFTMVEFYAAYLDYHYMMDFVEELLRTIAQQVCGTASLLFGEQVIDFGKSFARLTMKEAVMQYAKCAEHELSLDGIDNVLRKHQITSENQSFQTFSWGQKLFILFEELVEDKLIQPTFITEFPVEVSPLAKRNPHNRAITDRFELFMAGMELSNGFNELNDPFDQAERFKEQAIAHSGGDVEAHRYDADYVRALEYGLPPTVGVGIGIDRLVMIVTNTTSIKDVILFPTLKSKE